MSDQQAVSSAVETTDAVSRKRAPMIVLIVAIVVAGLFWMLVGAPTGESDSADTPLLGKPAPAIKTQTLDGAPFDLGRRKGSWVFLNFVQSTCVECIQEQPELVKFYAVQKKLGAAGAEFYSVIWNDPKPAIEEFFKKYGGSWPVLLDDDATIGVAYAVAKVPETWLISPDGIVMNRIIGATTADQLTATLIRAQQQVPAGQ